jgi:tRNA-2-methylthio-N6-dimethylallyladenosine synthase
MADLLAPLGYVRADAPEGADMVILNTCHIRERAAEKVYSELGRLRALKARKAKDGGRMLLAVAGCVAQAEGEEIVAREPAVDLVVGPQSYHRLPEMIARAARAGGHALETDFPALEKFDSLMPPQASGVSAFLTVQEGCDKFCTFCVVPYTRGSEHSRTPAAILREARQLADKGAREIVLLGQNVNAYDAPSSDNKRWSLAKLCDAIAEIEDIKRIRYTTSHPRDMSDDLIAAHGGNDKLMPYLHLPVQSGSDTVLEAMNRQHSADDYRRTIERVRASRPDIALTSDFIVGFPGESDADFEATLQLVRDIGYATAFSFKYSKRPGTPASTMRKQIPEEVKAARLEMLQKLLQSQQYSFDDSQIGKVLPVLFEKSAREAGRIMGRTPFSQPVHVQASADLIGSVADVKITRRTANSLHGTLAGKSVLA